MGQKILPKAILVLGGAASGKSAYAENLCMASGLSRTYIATSQAWDDEMRAKIVAHQAQRGPDWTTIEEPIDLTGAIAQVPQGHVCLVDCLTLWLTNIMLADHDIPHATDRLCTGIHEHPGPIIIVSNEVGQGITPDNKMAREFVNIQGRTNQRMAQICDGVVFVTAGIPQVLKGTL
ncbi:MAG: bifunctional adenosylcobinamide kinase/adenosylcobinamide-phosphate guanylyltransferase [Pseudomonadota bacterium]